MAKQKLSDEEFVALIETEKSELTTEGLGILEQQRSQSILAYTGEYSAGIGESPMSSAIWDIVRPSVDALTAFTTKPFVNKDTVVMSPMDPRMAPVGKQATMLLNTVMHRINPGYELIHDWIKSAALYKNSIWKVSWDDTPVTTMKEMRDVSPEEVDAYIYSLEQQGYEVTVVDEVVEMTDIEISSQELQGQEIIGGSISQILIILVLSTPCAAAILATKLSMISYLRGNL